MAAVLMTRHWRLYLAIWVFVFQIHVQYTLSADGVLIYPDSGTYYGHSRFPLASSVLWGASRPPGVLLFYKLLSSYDHEGHPDWGACVRRQHNTICPDNTLLWSQTLLNVAAFTLLALACANSSRTIKGSLVLFALPILFSLVPMVKKWNSIALSESFAFSLFVVFVALWILFLKNRQPSWLVWIAAAAPVWVGARDTNSYVLLMIAGVIIIVMLANILLTRVFQRPDSPVRRSTMLPLIHLVVLCIWFGIVFALSSFSADRGNRWQYPFYNILGRRILPVPEYIAYFADHGMPISPALLERTGASAGAFYHDSLEEFRTWTDNHGKLTYIRFLITHVIYSITAPGSEFQDNYLNEVGWLVHPDPGFPRVNVEPRLATAASNLLLVSYGGTVFLAGILWRRKWLSESPWLAVPLVMILLALPHFWLVWHGDAAEVQRHGLTAAVQAVLGFALLCLYVWDIWMGRAGDHSKLVVVDSSGDFREAEGHARRNGD